MTRTATVHARAWKEMFDEFLARWSERAGEEQEPFDVERDYAEFVDGKPRYDGVRSFLASRGITLPEGSPDDGRDADTVYGLGNWKNALYVDVLARDGVPVFPDAVACISAWRGQGLKLAIVTSSRNASLVLEGAGLTGLFEVQLDGQMAAERGLSGKPAPDIFVTAADDLGVSPSRAVVIEDSLAGVEAGRAGRFALVVGVDRVGQADALRAHGADVVVDDLRQLNLEPAGASQQSTAPELRSRLAEEIAAGRRIAFFFDYDGTLTPIVSQPEDALLSDGSRRALAALARVAPVSIVSGRDLRDVQALVGLDALVYAGSHGFDIAGPEDLRLEHDGGRESLPSLDAAEQALAEALGSVSGARVERKRYAIAVHYRNVEDRFIAGIEDVVDAIDAQHEQLRKTGGKKIFELRPRIAWDKGRAVLWLLDVLGLDGDDVLPVYVGDDQTDEDAFRALAQRGLSVLVGDHGERTVATYRLRDPDEVCEVLRDAVRLLGGTLDEEVPAEVAEVAPVEDVVAVAPAPRAAAERAPADDERGWLLVYDAWNREHEPLREALCAVGNGYLATRGAAEEASAGDAHYPGTYLAGGYNRRRSEVGGRFVENEDLVNWPNWLSLSFRPVDGEWLDLAAYDVLAFRQQLDLRHGVLRREVRVRDAAGRETSLVSRRLVSMEDPHLAAIKWTLTAENWSGMVEIGSALDGTVQNAGVARYRTLASQHLEFLDAGPAGREGVYLVVRTNQSLIRMAQAARTRVYVHDDADDVQRKTTERDGVIGQLLTVELAERRPTELEKLVAVFTSRDRGIGEPAESAKRAVGNAGRFDDVLARHQRAWSRLWRRCDIALDHDGEIQRILRLHIFHLLQTVSPHNADLDAGVPARGLHGEAYRGHIFWDELFIFPFLNLSMPYLTRSLLMYRYRRLPEARRAARAAGYAGAMFPWQSGSDGREESQVMHLNPKSGRWVPDNTHLQRHVNAAIAYNVWHHYLASGDHDFLTYVGAEMIFEIARFWASLATFSAERERYEVAGVVGPDEYHTAYADRDTPGVDNNAYTNVMASWVLRCALRVRGLLQQEHLDELAEKLELSDGNFDHWAEVSRRMFVPFHGDGIISQFEGYETLHEFDWDGYRAKYGDIQRLDRLLEAEGDSPNNYQIAKQADVVMLAYVFSTPELLEHFTYLGYELTAEQVERNVAYYAARTSHGSTLSRIVHAWVLARRDPERSWRLFEQALRSDVQDIQGGTTHEGIHLGVMAGTVDLVRRCYCGVTVREDGLWIEPGLPTALTDVAFRIRVRGCWLALRVTTHAVEVEVDGSATGSVMVGFGGTRSALAPGERRVFETAVS